MIMKIELRVVGQATIESPGVITVELGATTAPEKLKEF
jgi:hypothetical protein